MGHAIEEPQRERVAHPGTWPKFPSEAFERVRAGDQQALGEFFDHYFPRVFATVYRLVGNRALAEDVTQGVFLRLQSSLARVDGSRDLAPWLFTVCVNACRDHWRSSWWRMSRRSVSLEDPTVMAALISYDRDPEESALAKARDRRVQAALAHLPSTLRVAVVLHDCDGLGHEEIARITGVSHAAARKRHSRAIKLLGDLLRSQVGS